MTPSNQVVTEKYLEIVTEYIAQAEKITQIFLENMQKLKKDWIKDIENYLQQSEVGKIESDLAELI